MRHWRRWALVAVALWIVVATVWAFKPISATVVTGLNADGSEKTATVQCDSPLSGNTSPTEAVPTLGPRQSFGDAPCHGPVTGGRTMYFIDIAVALALLVFLVRSRGRFDERPERISTDETAALT
jgi:hypothetical protein